LYVYYLLRKKGLPVIYLGANVPIKDIEYIQQVKAPQYLYVHLTSFQNNTRFQRFLQQLNGQAEGRTILLSGFAAQMLKRNSLPNTVMLQTLTAVHSYIQAIK
jgi:hypothetical protein